MMNKGKVISMSEAVKLCGLSAEMIVYYEICGKIRAVQTMKDGQRRYMESDVWKLCGLPMETTQEMNAPTSTGDEEKVFGYPIGYYGEKARLENVRISSTILNSILRHGTDGFEIVDKALPNDAILVAVSFDGMNLSLTYHSAEFREVPAGGCPNIRDIMVRGK